jgi:uncharacterized protein YdaU (DUF1376 family)
VSESSPAFLFYASKFLAQTSSWSAAEVGAYIRLLICEWCNGSVPSNVNKLCKICGIPQVTFKKMWAESLSLMFHSNGDGTLVNQELENIREARRKYQLSQSLKGKSGAEKRWRPDGPGYA